MAWDFPLAARVPPPQVPRASRTETSLKSPEARVEDEPLPHIRVTSAARSIPSLVIRRTSDSLRWSRSRSTRPRANWGDEEDEDEVRLLGEPAPCGGITWVGKFPPVPREERTSVVHPDTLRL